MNNPTTYPRDTPVTVLHSRPKSEGRIFFVRFPGGEETWCDSLYGYVGSA